jgi:hypothetical protein
MRILGSPGLTNAAVIQHLIHSFEAHPPRKRDGAGAGLLTKEAFWYYFVQTQSFVKGDIMVAFDKKPITAFDMFPCIYGVGFLGQWYSTWDTRTTEDTRRHLR